MNKQTEVLINEMATAAQKVGEGFAKAAEAFDGMGTFLAAESERRYVAAGRPYDFHFVDGAKAQRRWLEEEASRT